MTDLTQRDLLLILENWNQGVATLVQTEFNRLNQSKRDLKRDLEAAEQRMNAALAYAEKHQPPQPAKKARV